VKPSLVFAFDFTRLRTGVGRTLTDDLGGGDHTLLESIEQGEDSAKHAYESALETKLPAGIDELARDQYASVKAAHDFIRQMEE
jgi:uncharacterized protein (TIGR02284 family)